MVKILFQYTVCRIADAGMGISAYFIHFLLKQFFVEREVPDVLPFRVVIDPIGAGQMIPEGIAKGYCGLAHAQGFPTSSAANGGNGSRLIAQP